MVPPVTGSTTGFLFVCTHRTLMDMVVLATVLGRNVPAVTYSISRLSEILSLIRTVRLSRDRQADAEGIRAGLANGDLVVCGGHHMQGALPAPVQRPLRRANRPHRAGGHELPRRPPPRDGARRWKATDPIFFFMNPRPIYEVTFLNQLPLEATCTAGKSPHDVAKYVQRILAASLGFECTKFTRKDKYRNLTGIDGTVNFKLATSPMERVKEVLGFLRCTI